MPRSKTGLAVIPALILLVLVPRLIGIDLFATIDEPYWLTAGSNFYYALGQRDFAHTVYDYHPAVTTMWIVTGALLLYFPQYRGLGQGYFDVYKDSLEEFLLAHGRTPLDLLATARTIQSVLVAALLIGLFLLLRRALDERVAAAAVLLMAFDPFLLGHSRLLNHEALMTLFVLSSVLALTIYLRHERYRILLGGSGIAAGLALLTKSSALVAVPIAGFLFVGSVFSAPRTVLKGRAGRVLVDAAIWLGALLTTYAILWPGMWVAPGEMLHEVFGNALSYALAGARLSVVDPNTAGQLTFHYADVAAYTQAMLWRTTPVVWFGTLLATVALFRSDPSRRLLLGVLLLTGVLVILLYSFASGRDSAHYVLLSYAVLDILAAAGYGLALSSLLQRLAPHRGPFFASLVLGAAIILQAASAIKFFPYYYNYYNPVMEALAPGRQNPNFGYGEGLDVAARYLDLKPGSTNSTAMAFYGRGPFSYVFKGATEPLKPVYADAENVPQLRQILGKSDYLVLYYALQRGRDVPHNVMRAVEDIAPEKSIWLNGIEYVRIYSMAAMPADFLDRLWP